MYKRYYSPFEEQPITKSYQAEIIKPKRVENAGCKQEDCETPSQKAGIFGKLSLDDIILIAILLLLLTEEDENRDIPLILAIGFLLLIEYIEK